MSSINYAIFNELSATASAENLGKAKQWMLSLCDVMKQAAKLQFRRLRTRDDFKAVRLVMGNSGEVIQVIRQLDRDNRNFILKVLDSPYLPGEIHDEAFVSHAVLSVGGSECTEAEGLLCAYIADTVAISFKSDRRWECDQLALGLKRDTGETLPIIQLPHACRADHLLLPQRLSWALRRTCERNERPVVPDCPLPNTKLSDQLVNNNWPEFFLSTSSLNPTEKTAKLRTIADDVAFINGYDHCPRRSSANGKRTGAIRQIFVSAFRPEGDQLFLSTDFETPAGAFEVCDRNGSHLGEWLFSGTKNGEADSSGRHDIEV